MLLVLVMKNRFLNLENKVLKILTPCSFCLLKKKIMPMSAAHCNFFLIMKNEHASYRTQGRLLNINQLFTCTLWMETMVVVAKFVTF